MHAVNGVSFTLRSGETVGVVGESGSGKSVTMLSLLRLLPSPPAKITAGSALFHGEDLVTMSDRRIRDARGSQISMVFQDPMTSFNAVLTIGRQITEPLEVHLGMSRARARTRAAELLDLVGIPNARQTAPGLSPPVLRRHAAARHDRHGPGLPSADPHRRRAHHRPGRHHPGADRRAGEEAARRAGHGGHLDHARPGHHRRAGPAGHRDVRRLLHRGSAGQGTVRRSPPPLHDRAPGQPAARGCGASAGALPPSTGCRRCCSRSPRRALSLRAAGSPSPGAGRRIRRWKKSPPGTGLPAGSSRSWRKPGHGRPI